MSRPRTLPRAPTTISPISRSARTAGAAFTYQPVVDVLDGSDTLLIIADLPGVDPDAISVEIASGEVSITAPVPTHERAGTSMMRQEFGVGNFHRRVPIDAAVGDAIDPAHVRAIYRDGTLTIELPKRESARRMRVPVTVVPPTT